MTTIVRQTQLPVRTFRMDPDTVRAALDRAFRRRGERALATIMATFGLSVAATGRLFRVSRHAVELWQRNGVPPARLADVDRVAHLALTMQKVFRRERLPAVVREALPGLENRSILEAIAAEGVSPVLLLIRRLRSWVPAP
jgi:hypothetical protein